MAQWKFIKSKNIYINGFHHQIVSYYEFFMANWRNSNGFSAFIWALTLSFLFLSTPFVIMAIAVCYVVCVHLSPWLPFEIVTQQNARPDRHTYIHPRAQSISNKVTNKSFNWNVPIMHVEKNKKEENNTKYRKLIAIHRIFGHLIDCLLCTLNLSVDVFAFGVIHIIREKRASDFMSGNPKIKYNWRINLSELFPKPPLLIR